MPPTGMSTGLVELSDKAAAQHELDAVVATYLNDGRGDGWVANEWRSRHLGGSIIQLRLRETIDRGSYYQLELVPIDNVMKQTELVGTKIDAEVLRLEGYYDEKGKWVPGEVEEVAAQPHRLRNWLTLGEPEKQHVRAVYAGIAKARHGASNTYNRIAGDISRRMLELGKNPQAMLWTNPTLESELEGRDRQLHKNLLVQIMRSNRLAGWLLEENKSLTVAAGYADDLLTKQDDESLNMLKLRSRHIKFRVQPFNQFAGAIGGRHGRVQSPDQVETLIQGLHFMRVKNYLLIPFRQLAKVKFSEIKSHTENVEQILADLAARQEGLEEMELRGPYGELANRIGAEAADAIKKVKEGKAKEARIHAEAAKILIAHHASGPNDMATVDWYREQLASAA